MRRMVANEAQFVVPCKSALSLDSVLCGILFFFSSRRRHTRFDCDWSSDVCSSDLAHVAHVAAAGYVADQSRHLASAERAPFVKEAAINHIASAVTQHHAAAGVERREDRKSVV